MKRLLLFFCFLLGILLSINVSYSKIVINADLDTGETSVIQSPTELIEDTNNLYIKTFNIDIDVSKNKSASVTENLDVYFKNKSHGIIRKIPYNYATIKYPFVEKEKYHSEQCTTTVDYSTLTSTTKCLDGTSGVLPIKIGDKNKYVNGDKHYKITYHYDSQNYDNKNEFVYRLDPNFNVPVNQVNFKIKMPDKIDKNNIQIYVGGKTDTLGIEYSVDENIITGKTRRVIQPEEAISLEISLPDGYFNNNIFLDFEHILALITTFSLVCCTVSTFTLPFVLQYEKSIKRKWKRRFFIFAICSLILTILNTFILISYSTTIRTEDIFINFLDLLLAAIPLYLGAFIYYKWYKIGREDTVISYVNFKPSGYIKNALEADCLYNSRKASNKGLVALFIELVLRGNISINKDTLVLKTTDGLNTECLEDDFVKCLFGSKYSSIKKDQLESRALAISDLIGNSSKLIQQYEDSNSDVKRITLNILACIAILFFLYWLSLSYPAVISSVLLFLLFINLNKNKNSGCLFALFVVFAFLIILISLACTFMTGTDFSLKYWFPMLCCILSFIVGVFCYIYMPKLTEKGKDIRAIFFGFERYLNTISQFTLSEELLPYIYILKSSKKIIRKSQINSTEISNVMEWANLLYKYLQDT